MNTTCELVVGADAWLAEIEKEHDMHQKLTELLADCRLAFGARTEISVDEANRIVAAALKRFPEPSFCA